MDPETSHEQVDVNFSSDEEDIQWMASVYEQVVHMEQQEAIGPSIVRGHIFRERELADERLRADYFDRNCKYPAQVFRRRFLMSRRLFLQIVEGIKSYTTDYLPAHFKFFSESKYCTGRSSISALLKCTSVIRQLAYGNSPNAFDEYLQIGGSTSYECLDNFNKCIIDLFMPEYLRKPTWSDIQRIYKRHESHHDFPGMLGSIDCMHWEQTNCPVAWHGQFSRGDKKKYPTIMLEAVASQDLWIWHAFFGIAGANNDINVLDNSPLFDDILDDVAPAAPYMVNEMRYEKGYYLTDGIYPQWATFVKSFSATTDAKHGYFKRKQESARKDVERTFGVLQGRWGIIRQPARAMEVVKIRRIMYSCIILHNMILKDQKFSLREFNDMWVDPSARLRINRWVERCDGQRRRAREIRDRETHTRLQRDLMEHVWQKRLQHQEEEYSEDDE